MTRGYLTDRQWRKAAIARAKRLSGEKPTQWSRRQMNGSHFKSRPMTRRTARTKDEILGGQG